MQWIARSVILLLGTLAVFNAGGAPPVAQPIHLAPGEHISAAVLDETSTSWIAVSRPGALRSRLLEVSPSGAMTEHVVTDRAINVLANPSPNVLWTGGLDAEGYAWQVVRVSPQGLETLWSSRDLGPAWQGEQTWLELAEDERSWIGTRVERGSMRLIGGDVSSSKPQWDVVIERSEATSTRPSFSEDFPAAEILTMRPEPILALAWAGRVGIYQPERGELLAYLDTNLDPSNLFWQPEDRSLWVHGEGTLIRFEIPRELLTKAAVSEPPAALAPTRTLDEEDLGFAPSGVELLEEGGLVMTGGRSGHHRAASISASQAPIEHLRLEEKSSIVAASRQAGRWLLVLPEGPDSDTAVLRSREP